MTFGKVWTRLLARQDKYYGTNSKAKKVTKSSTTSNTSKTKRYGQKEKEKERQEKTRGSWLEYFEGIQDVCPWSLGSYKNGTLHIQEFSLQSLADNLRSQDTFVYTIKEDITVDALQEIVHRLNKSQKKQEFLWSHPAYTDGSNNQTSVAVIIQQDRKTLRKLRKNYGTFKKR